MATYIDLRNLYSGSTESDLLNNRIEFCVSVAADFFLQNGGTPDEDRWTSYVLSNPAIEAKKAFIAHIARSKELTIVQITSMSDVDLQIAIDSIIDGLVTAYNSNL